MRPRERAKPSCWPRVFKGRGGAPGVDDGPRRRAETCSRLRCSRPGAGDGPGAWDDTAPDDGGTDADSHESESARGR